MSPFIQSPLDTNMTLDDNPIEKRRKSFNTDQISENTNL